MRANLFETNYASMENTGGKYYQKDICNSIPITVLDLLWSVMVMGMKEMQPDR